MFEAQKVHLVSQAASDLNLTFVVDEAQAPRLVEKLHALLFESGGSAVAIEGAIVAHDIDTDDGQSGCPIWRDSDQRVVAIHTSGKDVLNPNNNRGVVLGPELIAWLQDIIQ